MHILFIHDNFPAQFGGLGSYLAAEGWDVSFLTKRQGAKADDMHVVVYRERELENEGKGVHGFLRSTNRAMVNGGSVLEVGMTLKKRGIHPDVVVAHSGWGGGLFVKDVWPDAAYVAYCEWFYDGDADDLIYLRGRRATPSEKAVEKARNTPIIMDLLSADLVIVPTAFQASQFPEVFKNKIRVMHDGIDTDRYAPRNVAAMTLDDVVLDPGDEIITYVARGMEPYRGFPEFMRAIDILQSRRPALKTAILGQDRVAYGRKLPDGDSWKKRMLNELSLDESRVAMPGLVPRSAHAQLMNLSSVHCYLTVPFVLSWSMIEAMASGCLLVASDTAPVRELIDHGVHGQLCDMRDPERIADAIESALDDEPGGAKMRAEARKRAVSGYRAADQFAAKKVLFAELARARAS